MVFTFWETYLLISKINFNIYLPYVNEYDDLFASQKKALLIIKIYDTIALKYTQC